MIVRVQSTASPWSKIKILLRLYVIFLFWTEFPLTRLKSARHINLVFISGFYSVLTCKYSLKKSYYNKLLKTIIVITSHKSDFQWKNNIFSPYPTSAPSLTRTRRPHQTSRSSTSTTRLDCRPDTTKNVLLIVTKTG